ncbi:PRC-barrel domain-containing protein [Henriciella sp.]|uniref:PRC-barrel domain-containing protein n=1 Tax=Henriciella sp. TaxID=1968823 RepID=UPI002603EC68|nr:PRC-barrel domain-containing protein [Henriciella sp.]
MKPLMTTAALSALMLGMAACSQSSDDIAMSDNEDSMSATEAEQTTGTDEMAEDDANMMDADTEMADASTETTYLGSSEISADSLIGAEVIGSDGEKIANVEDLLVDASGQIDSLIFRSGEVIDVAGDKGALAYDQVDLTMNDGEDPRFTVAMSDEAINQVAEFEQEGLNDYRLISEMIGTTADLSGSDDSARIEDVILDSSGRIQYAVVTDPAVMDEMRVIGFDRISVDGSDNSKIMIDATVDELSTMSLFEYQERMNDEDMSTDDMDMTPDSSMESDADMEDDDTTSPK